MEEAIRNRIILILAVLCIILFIGSLSSCGNVYRLKRLRDKEMAMRLDIEEKINKFSQENATLQERLNRKDVELTEERSSHQATKKAMAQEQLVNESIKDELQKVTKLKETLEADLKEALVACKTKSKK